MKRLIPDSHITLVWFIAGIYATGALWYFLSKDEFVGAALSVFGAAALAVLAVYLHRLNDKDERRRALRELLAGFLKELQALRARANEMPPPMDEYSAWVKKVTEYLGASLDRSFATRFGDFSGLTFYSSNPNSGFKTDIDGRAMRLHEFIVGLGGAK